MIDLTKLVGYRAGIAPVQPESFPTFVNRELQRISVVSGDIIDAIKAGGGGSSSSSLTLDGGDAYSTSSPAYTIEGGSA